LDSKDVSDILNSNKKAQIKTIADSLFMEVMSRAAQQSGITIDRLMNIPAGKKRNLHDDISLIVFDLKH